MATAKPFVPWKISDERKAEETARLQREKASQIVKVIVPEIDDGEVIVYREGRKGLKHQPLTPEENEMLNGDERAFFNAFWNVTLMRWDLVSRATNQRW